eukprot:GEMP01001369.1.p1 GENE.GEMP01001369.1~~GEMP01001369.1.p1  ORF type:complete len:1528 (+),score=247.04 GEMP01001369.1:90-4673(+)
MLMDNDLLAWGLEFGLLIERRVAQSDATNSFLCTKVAGGRRHLFAKFLLSSATVFQRKRFLREYAVGKYVALPKDQGDFELVTIAKTLFYLMPFVEQAHMVKNTSKSKAHIEELISIPEEALLWMLTLLQQLDRAATLGVVHGMICPENLLIERNLCVAWLHSWGDAVLLEEPYLDPAWPAIDRELLLAAASDTDIPVGKYASPEQLDEEPSINSSSDIYSVTKTLCCVLAATQNGQEACGMDLEPEGVCIFGRTLLTHLGAKCEAIWARALLDSAGVRYCYPQEMLADLLMLRESPRIAVFSCNSNIKYTKSFALLFEEGAQNIEVHMTMLNNAGLLLLIYLLKEIIKHAGIQQVDVRIDDLDALHRLSLKHIKEASDIIGLFTVNDDFGKISMTVKNYKLNLFPGPECPDEHILTDNELLFVMTSFVPHVKTCNRITAQRLLAMINAHQLSTIRVLDLDGTELGEELMEPLCEILGHDSLLSILRLNGTGPYTYSMAKSLGRAITQSKMLKELFLDNNGIQSPEGLLFAESLLNNATLMLFSLQDNPLQADVVEPFFHALRRVEGRIIRVKWLAFHPILTAVNFYGGYYIAELTPLGDRQLCSYYAFDATHPFIPKQNKSIATRPGRRHEDTYTRTHSMLPPSVSSTSVGSLPASDKKKFHSPKPGFCSLEQIEELFNPSGRHAYSKVRISPMKDFGVQGNGSDSWGQQYYIPRAMERFVNLPLPMCFTPFILQDHEQVVSQVLPILRTFYDQYIALHRHPVHAALRYASLLDVTSEYHSVLAVKYRAEAQDYKEIAAKIFSELSMTAVVNIAETPQLLQELVELVVEGHCLKLAADARFTVMALQMWRIGFADDQIAGTWRSSEHSEMMPPCAEFTVVHSYKRLFWLDSKDFCEKNVWVLWGLDGLQIGDDNGPRAMGGWDRKTDTIAWSDGSYWFRRYRELKTNIPLWVQIRCKFCHFGRLQQRLQFFTAPRTIFTHNLLAQIASNIFIHLVIIGNVSFSSVPLHILLLSFLIRELTAFTLSPSALSQTNSIRRHAEGSVTRVARHEIKVVHAALSHGDNVISQMFRATFQNDYFQHQFQALNAAVCVLYLIFLSGAWNRRLVLSLALLGSWVRVIGYLNLLWDRLHHLVTQAKRIIHSMFAFVILYCICAAAFSSSLAAQERGRSTKCMEDSMGRVMMQVWKASLLEFTLNRSGENLLMCLYDEEQYVQLGAFMVWIAAGAISFFNMLIAIFINHFDQHNPQCVARRNIYMMIQMRACYGSNTWQTYLLSAPPPFNLLLLCYCLIRYIILGSTDLFGCIVDKTHLLAVNKKKQLSSMKLDNENNNQNTPDRKSAFSALLRRCTSSGRDTWKMLKPMHTSRNAMGEYMSELKPTGSHAESYDNLEMPPRFPLKSPRKTLQRSLPDRNPMKRTYKIFELLPDVLGQFAARAPRGQESPYVLQELQKLPTYPNIVPFADHFFCSDGSLAWEAMRLSLNVFPPSKRVPPTIPSLPYDTVRMLIATFRNKRPLNTLYYQLKKNEQIL